MKVASLYKIVRIVTCTLVTGQFLLLLRDTFPNTAVVVMSKTNIPKKVFSAACVRKIDS